MSRPLITVRSQVRSPAGPTNKFRDLILSTLKLVASRHTDARFGILVPFDVRDCSPSVSAHLPASITWRRCPLAPERNSCSVRLRDRVLRLVWHVRWPPPCGRCVCRYSRVGCIRAGLPAPKRSGHAHFALPFQNPCSQVNSNKLLEGACVIWVQGLRALEKFKCSFTLSLTLLKRGHPGE